MDSADLTQSPQQLLAFRELGDELLAGHLVRRRIEERGEGIAQLVGGGGVRRGQQGVERESRETCGFGEPDFSGGVLGGIVKRKA